MTPPARHEDNVRRGLIIAIAVLVIMLAIPLVYAAWFVYHNHLTFGQDSDSKS